ncbi:hypothetical protein KC19_6G004700 [Ceratodon purpureus]|uniref:Uncharacterized protein n=1 Tax=Ceratodon purpureus TaxID=3225 RepID=A0A8T0HGR0_CERPU|nr:hypothetical protein KC19_6G004700 [Ceratodon purpureus]
MCMRSWLFTRDWTVLLLFRFQGCSLGKGRECRIASTPSLRTTRRGDDHYTACTLLT